MRKKRTRKTDKETFNIKYEIVGREDGRWVVRAFDRNHKPLGVEITIHTPNEAWRIWMVLNGYCDLEPTEIIDEMKKAA